MSIKGKLLDKPNNFSGQNILAKNQVSLNKNKVTWEKLDQITFKDLNMLLGLENSPFDPKELIDEETNDEDNFYL
jgi:hypothetical protein